MLSHCVLHSDFRSFSLQLLIGPNSKSSMSLSMFVSMFGMSDVSVLFDDDPLDCESAATTAAAAAVGTVATLDEEEEELDSHGTDTEEESTQEEESIWTLPSLVCALLFVLSFVCICWLSDSVFVGSAADSVSVGPRGVSIDIGCAPTVAGAPCSLSAAAIGVWGGGFMMDRIDSTRIDLC